jgi:hypothetical protein|uniref:Uncharacterized protein n=1 Tax=viral metagenome TaxID=1070528 RepID=A0A6C0JT13_9ZZZZ
MNNNSNFNNNLISNLKKNISYDKTYKITELKQILQSAYNSNYFSKKKITYHLTHEMPLLKKIDIKKK